MAAMALGIATLLLFGGCSALPIRYSLAKYQPANIYRQTDLLPPKLHRVAVLPLTVLVSTPWLEAGEETLYPVILTELQKARRFEVVTVTPEQLEQWTGRKAWKAGEALPEDFFQKIYRGAGTDAVLFSQLTHCQPYPPLELGWRFNLVANTSPTREVFPGPVAPDFLREHGGILWSADEIFNAGVPSVARGAKAYMADNGQNTAPLADSTSVLSSPVQFGQYTLSTLFATLPAR